MSRPLGAEARALAEAALRWFGAPACALDLETTGPIPEIDDIVSCAIGRYDPHADTVEWWASLFRPSVAMTAGATAAHGLTEADLVDAPAFAQRWPHVYDRLHGAVWVGHGIRRFDRAMIEHAFARLPGAPAPPEPVAIIDTLGLMTRYEPRRLAAAVAHYCGRVPTAAHTADGDAVDAADVLGAMIARYGLDALGAGNPLARARLLEALSQPEAPTGEETADWVEPSGRFVWRGSVAYCAFGPRTRGQRVDQIDQGFWRWLLKQGESTPDDPSRGFPPAVRAIAVDALVGRYPQRGGGAAPAETPTLAGEMTTRSQVHQQAPLFGAET